MSRRFGLAFGFEGLGDDSAVSFLEKDFDFAFGFFELFLAFGGKGDALFEELHGIIERELRTLQFADYFFEPRQAALEVGLLGRIGFLGSRCVHLFFAANSLRQGEDGKQVRSVDLPLEPNHMQQTASVNHGLRVSVCLRVAAWAESENGATIGVPSYQ